MTDSFRPRPLDRYTRIGDLANSVRWMVQRALIPAAVILAVETALLFYTGSRGAPAFALIALGTVIVLSLWRSKGIGLPLVPLLALQNLVVYGLPVVIGHDVLTLYPANYITAAGFEVLVFSVSLIGFWTVGMGFFHPAPSTSYALRSFQHEGAGKLRRIGFSLLIGSSLYLLLDSLQLTGVLLGLLPEGSYSLISTLISAAGACGFFLIAMFVGSRDVSSVGQIAFWALLAGDCFISASGFLLSATTALVASVMIGLFWSTGRMPWRYLVVVVSVLSFLNLGKFTMRERYWTAEGDQPPTSLGEMPRQYAEWIQASYEAIAPAEQVGLARDDHEKQPKAQSLLERVNNLQNLLFVIDAIDAGHIAPLRGATYTLIPPLLLPRILWPDKPRTHEGQILLNVHFGRQELDSTFQTYIAWGLLAEAYGNFGAVVGALALGAFLGLSFAWLENFTARKLLVSLEGFISFTLLLGIMGSFEMVASVLITSVFQSVMVLVAASLPFVEKTSLPRLGAKPT